MFETIQPAPPDPILGLSEAFRKDPRPDKVNLSVGVYKDAEGRTPALDCVQAAQRKLAAGNGDMGYLAIDGLAAYDELVRHLLLSAAGAESRAATAQTPGGTGALRVAAEFLHRTAPGTAMFCSTPTWANHPNVFSSGGLEVGSYKYADAQQRGLDFAAMMESIGALPAGSAVCLHGCCHNPTGIDPSPSQWDELGQLLQQRGILPLVDIAYQGLGAGIEQDLAGVTAIVNRCPEVLICSSFSKNFSMYGERVGALTVVGQDAAAAAAMISHVKACIRSNYSSPPRFGASVVATVLADAALRAQWEQELAQMRDRINSMRRLFVSGMAAAAPEHDFSFIQQQRGMFSNSGLTRMQVDELRNSYSIYIVGSGRINVAGMTETNLDRLCAAIASVL